jgi:transcriptional regulator with XRE-family HTH domain
MRISSTLTDAAIQRELGQRIARARLDRGLTQAALAAEAGISKPTLERLEAGASARLTTVVRVLRVLDLVDNLEALVPPDEPSPVELLRAQRSRTQRARRPARRPGRAWRWGDESDEPS